MGPLWPLILLCSDSYFPNLFVGNILKAPPPADCQAKAIYLLFPFICTLSVIIFLDFIYSNYYFHYSPYTFRNLILFLLYIFLYLFI